MITPERGHYLAAAIASLCDAGLLRATAAGHVVMGAQLPPPGPGGPPPGRPVPVLEVRPDAEHLGVAA